MALYLCRGLAPRRKRSRPHEVLRAPWPVPSVSDSATKADPGTWPVYYGDLDVRTGRVHVTTGAEAVALFTQGYFGSPEAEDRPRAAAAAHRVQTEAVRPELQPEDLVATRRDQGAVLNAEPQGRWSHDHGRSPLDEQGTLILAGPEAFFLSYALGCLVVRVHGQALDLASLWSSFCHERTDFPVRYRVYHHLRAQGWVVRDGLQFGVDYLLYQAGPPFYHSSYSVQIRQCTPSDPHALSWRDLFGLNRITEATAKELLLVEVTPEHGPLTMSRVLASPEHLPELRVRETVVRRWIPTQARLDPVSPTSVL